MSALLGQSLLHDVARILGNTNPISYYQYRAIVSLLEVIILHDKGILFVGDETDASFINEYYSLIENIEAQSDFKFEIVNAGDAYSLVGGDEFGCFKRICLEIYGYELGATLSDLLIKSKKDRLAEDMSEHIENAFIKRYPEFDSKSTAEQIYDLWQRNSNSSELKYFFRGHLYQALSEVKQLTPFFENQKILASVLQKVCRTQNRIGTLAFTIYNLVNARFLAESKELYSANFPLPSLLLSAAVVGAANREQILENALVVRQDLASFRKAHNKIEATLSDPDESLSIRMQRKTELQQALEVLWIPTLHSFSSGLFANSVWRATKVFFGKYGIGELKLSATEKTTSSEASATLSTPSLIGLSTAAIQTIFQHAKENSLFEPSRPVIDLLGRVLNQKGLHSDLDDLLAVKDQNYKINKFLEGERIDLSTEAKK